jgi:hypothetical protein
MADHATLREEVPEPGAQLTTVEHIQDGDWVRLAGHVDWRKAVGGVISLGPITRVLWANMTSDMLDGTKACEVLRGRVPSGMRAV